MMLRFFCLLPALLGTLWLPAQPMPLDWVNEVRCTYNNGITTGVRHGVASDSEGNVYSFGSFLDTLDFDPGPDTLWLGSGAFTTYLQKVNAQGELVWARQVGVSGTNFGRDIFLDAQDNIYVAGSFMFSVGIAADTGTLVFQTRGGIDMYVAKFTPQGNLLWATHLGSANGDALNGMRVTPDGHVYVSASYNGTAYFVPGDSTLSFTARGGSDIFLTKLDPDGDLAWIRVFGGKRADIAGTVAPDAQGNVVLTFAFHDSLDADPGPGTWWLKAHDDKADVAIIKLTAAGDLIWATKAGLAGIQTPTSLAVDPWNNVIVAGEYVFGGYAGFVTQVDSLGHPGWFHIIPSDHWPYVVVDSLANVYVSSIWEDSWDMDPGPGVYMVTCNGAGVYVAQFNPQGIFKSGWVLERGISLPTGMAMGANQTLVIGGNYTAFVDFDPGPDTTLRVGADEEVFHIFTAQYRICAQAAPVDTAYAAFGCDSYQSPGGLQTWTSPGVYTDTLDLCGNTATVTLSLGSSSAFAFDTTVYCEGLSLNGTFFDQSGTYQQYLLNQAGCDSVLTVHLAVVEDLADTLMQAGEDLIAPAGAASYQWIDCGQAGAPIAGATGPVFQPQQSGTYAAILQQGNCADTTACWAFVRTSLEAGPAATWQVFPNPAQRVLYIELDQAYPTVTVRCISGLGQVWTLPTQAQHGQAYQVELPAAAGRYWLEVVAGGRARRWTIERQ